MCPGRWRVADKDQDNSYAGSLMPFKVAFPPERHKCVRRVKEQGSSGGVSAVLVEL